MSQGNYSTWCSWSQNKLFSASRILRASGFELRYWSGFQTQQAHDDSNRYTLALLLLNFVSSLHPPATHRKGIDHDFVISWFQQIQVYYILSQETALILRDLGSKQRSNTPGAEVVGVLVCWWSSSLIESHLVPTRPGYWIVLCPVGRAIRIWVRRTKALRSYPYLYPEVGRR